jgi:ABC-type antimicrobial peptide transport system permease subunit
LHLADSGPGANGSSLVDVLDYRVTANYFPVAGLGFLNGQGWRDGAASGPPVVVLDTVAARALFGDADPIGRRVRGEGATAFTIIGTVPHVYTLGPEDEHPPSAYFPLAPNPARTLAEYFVKTSRPADDMIVAITHALEPVAPAMNDPFVFSADDALSKITARRRFSAQLMSVFGLMGMLIGAAGVYAVMASFVAQQTREIGVRTALGATPSRIQRSVLRRAWRHLLAGLGLGIPVAWWLSRGLTALLFQVTPADVSVYLSVSALLITVGLVAAWLPARRAARIDPIICLRR